MTTIVQYIHTILQTVGVNLDYDNFSTYIHDGATLGAGISNHSGAHEFTPNFSGVRVARWLIFCALLCGSLFVLFSFFHSNDIFKLFLIALLYLYYTISYVIKSLY
jgi:hypothetical protein